MGAIKNYLLDTHEVVEDMTKRDELLEQLLIQDWASFTDGLADILITRGWKCPAQIKLESQNK